MPSKEQFRSAVFTAPADVDFGDIPSYVRYFVYVKEEARVSGFLEFHSTITLFALKKWLLTSEISRPMYSKHFTVKNLLECPTRVGDPVAFGSPTHCGVKHVPWCMRQTLALPMVAVFNNPFRGPKPPPKPRNLKRRHDDGPDKSLWRPSKENGGF